MPLVLTLAATGASWLALAARQSGSPSGGVHVRVRPRCGPALAHKRLSHNPRARLAAADLRGRASSVGAIARYCCLLRTCPLDPAHASHTRSYQTSSNALVILVAVMDLSALRASRADRRHCGDRVRALAPPLPSQRRHLDHALPGWRSRSSRRPASPTPCSPASPSARAAAAGSWAWRSSRSCPVRPDLRIVWQTGRVDRELSAVLEGIAWDEFRARDSRSSATRSRSSYRPTTRTTTSARCLRASRVPSAASRRRCWSWTTARATRPGTSRAPTAQRSHAT